MNNQLSEKQIKSWKKIQRDFWYARLSKEQRADLIRKTIGELYRDFSPGLFIYKQSAFELMTISHMAGE